MPALSKHPGLDGALRLNRLDGAALYFGRRGRLGPVDATRLEAFLAAWHVRDRHLRMGMMPVIEAGAFDDGRPRTVDALLGDRMVDFHVDDDFVVVGMLRSFVGEFIAGKQAALKPKDREALATLAATHNVGLGDLLDGPWSSSRRFTRASPRRRRRSMRVPAGRSGSA